MADAGFALPAMYEWCEQEGIYYTIGLVPNPRLEALAAALVSLAEVAGIAVEERYTASEARKASEGPEP